MQPQQAAALAPKLPSGLHIAQYGEASGVRLRQVPLVTLPRLCTEAQLHGSCGVELSFTELKLILDVSTCVTSFKVITYIILNKERRNFEEEILEGSALVGYDLAVERSTSELGAG